MSSRRTVLAAGAGVTAALAAGGTARADDRSPLALLTGMTPEEKVGQLFVVRVYGHSATAPDQADIDANLEELGVRTAAELVARYRVGGIIYFSWAHPLLPLSPRTHPRLLVVGADPASPSGTTGPPTGVLAAALDGLGFTATALSTGTGPSDEVIGQAVAAAGAADAVVVTTYNVTASSPQRALVERLAAGGRPVVAVALRNPYDVAQLPSARACLATYSWSDVELLAAARVIAGTVRPRGRLPVAVPRADDPARVLFPLGHGLGS